MFLIHEIPFAQAASIGTHRRSLRGMKMIGVVVTTDATIGELERESYIDAEEKTIQELKEGFGKAVCDRVKFPKAVQRRHDAAGGGIEGKI